MSEAHHYRQCKRRVAALRRRSADPVTTTIMGVGAFPETDPLSLRWLACTARPPQLGVNGDTSGAKARHPMKQIAPGDLLLHLRALRRPVTGNVPSLRTCTIFTLTLTPPRSTKQTANLPIVSDIKYALGRLADMIKSGH